MTEIDASEHRTCEKCKVTLLTDPLDVETGVGPVKIETDIFLLRNHHRMNTMLCGICARALMVSVAGWLGRDVGMYDARGRVPA